MTTPVSNTGSGHYAEVNGLKLYYEIHGDGFPLALIHGGGSTIYTTFGRVLPDLAKAHKVIAVEMQAHGHTRDIDREMTFEQDADDIAGLLHHLNIPKANLFGFSNGASTSLYFAIRHPGLVNKIIVASTMFNRAGAFKGFWEMMEHASFDGMPQAYKDAYLRITPDDDALYTMYRRDITRMQNFRDIPEKEIEAIQCPALILCGNHDVCTVEHAVELYRKMKHARLAIFPGGHGDYIGELTTLQPGQESFVALPFVLSFLTT